jgi:sugar/nucleoside kinase (ribokinase family)
MATSNESELRMYTSNPGHTKTSFGGVARNISEAIARLGHAPLFLSAVADDPFGETLRRHCIEELNMSDRGLRVVSSDLARTGMYVALFDKHGDLQSAVADADIAKNFVTSEFVRKFRTEIQNASVVVVDANLCETTLSEIGDMVTGCCWLEPTSVAKAASFVRAGLLKHVSVISPNEDELDAMFREITHTSSSRSSDVDLETKSRRVLNEMKEDSSVVVTLGEQGVAIMSTNEDNMSYFEPGNVESIKNCTGAGDTLVGATVWAMAHRNLSLDDAVRSVGMRAAERTLASEEPVCPTLSSMEETGLFF